MSSSWPNLPTLLSPQSGAISPGFSIPVRANERQGVQPENYILRIILLCFLQKVFLCNEMAPLPMAKS